MKIKTIKLLAVSSLLLMFSCKSEQESNATSERGLAHAEREITLCEPYEVDDIFSEKREVEEKLSKVKNPAKQLTIKIGHGNYEQTNEYCESDEMNYKDRFECSLFTQLYKQVLPLEEELAAIDKKYKACVPDKCIIDYNDDGQVTHSDIYEYGLGKKFPNLRAEKKYYGDLAEINFYSNTSEDKINLEKFFFIGEDYYRFSGCQNIKMFTGLKNFYSAQPRIPDVPGYKRASIQEIFMRTAPENTKKVLSLLRKGNLTGFKPVIEYTDFNNKVSWDYNYSNKESISYKEFEDKCQKVNRDDVFTFKYFDEYSKIEDRITNYYVTGDSDGSVAIEVVCKVTKNKKTEK